MDNYEEVNAKQFVFTLQDLDTLTVKVDVPESVMIKVRRGERPKVFALFDSIPDREFPLTFKEFSAQADSNSNTYEVTLALPSVGDYNVLPGMSVTARAEPTRRESSLHTGVFVPAHAVLEDAAGRYVWVVTPSEAGLGLISRRRVGSGTLSQLGLEILEGLKEGEHVVSAGMSKMHESLRVRFHPEESLIQEGAVQDGPVQKGSVPEGTVQEMAQ